MICETMVENGHLALLDIFSVKSLELIYYATFFKIFIFFGIINHYNQNLN